MFFCALNIADDLKPSEEVVARIRAALPKNTIVFGRKDEMTGVVTIGVMHGNELHTHMTLPATMIEDTNGWFASPCPEVTARHWSRFAEDAERLAALLAKARATP